MSTEKQKRYRPEQHPYEVGWPVLFLVSHQLQVSTNYSRADKNRASACRHRVVATYNVGTSPSGGTYNGSHALKDCKPA